MKYIRAGLIDQSANTHLTEALRVDDLVFISGQFAGDTRFRLVGGDDIAIQAEYVFDKIRNLLEEAGAAVKHLTMLHYFVVDLADVDVILSVSGRHLGQNAVPAAFVQVPQLALNGARIGITAIAVAGAERRITFGPGNGTSSVGSTRALRVDDLIFMSSAGSGDASSERTKDHTRALLVELDQLMLRNGASREQIGWLQFFVRDPDDILSISRACRNFFGSKPPASSIVRVRGLPAPSRISATAIGCLTSDQKRIRISDAGHRCEAFASGNLVFVSGQLATDHGPSVTGAGDLPTQTDFVFRRLEQTLHDAGCALNDVAWLQFFLADLGQRTLMTPSRRARFGSHRPAAGLMQVGGPFQPSLALLEVAAIAVKAGNEPSPKPRKPQGGER